MSHQSGRNDQRESKRQSQAADSDSDIEIDDVPQRLADSTAAVRAKAQRHVLGQLKDVFAYPADGVEAAAMRATDSRLDAAEREQLLRIGTVLSLGESAGKFAGAWPDALLKVVVDAASEQGADALVAAALAALTLAGGSADGDFTSGDGTAVIATLLTEVKLPSSPTVLSAYLRCVASVVTDVANLGKVDKLIRATLSHDDLDVVTAAVEALGIVSERFPQDTSLNGDDLGSLANLSPGKNERKEFYAQVRRVQAGIDGEPPVETLNVAVPHSDTTSKSRHSGVEHHELTGFHQHELVRCLKSFTHEKTNSFYIWSPAVRAMLNVTFENAQYHKMTDLNQHAYQKHLRETAEKHDRTVVEKARNQDIHKSRDRKHDAARGEEDE